MKPKISSSRKITVAYLCAILWSFCFPAWSQEPARTVFQGVRVFDGSTGTLSPAQNVLIENNTILQVSREWTQEMKTAPTKIDGKGKTLIPGLIDVHLHLVFGSLSMVEMLSPGLNQEGIMNKAGKGAEEMLMRGFTSVRDVGGPIFPLKNAIDQGKILGPRVWPSGAIISQTAGHGDFRTPDERSRKFFGTPSRAELFGATFIADGKPEVLTAVRENLRFGASQIKLMAGGGTSSAYDPIDVTQYTLEEMQAAVEAAEDWGTYVTVHAYTDRAVQKAIQAGVRCVEHGQMVSEETLQLMAEKGIWLSLQNLMEDSPNMDPARREKRKPVLEGQKKVWAKAKELGVKLAWGTDFLFEPELNREQNAYILKLQEWFSPAEILKMITHDNAQLLALSGNRSPYRGELGVVKTGALADLILVDGNPLEDLSLLAQPEEKFLVIMKDGKVVKNRLK
ncbi:metal-dependent hydrolase family protein [Algoriphagus taiwanensis]|uniref:Amidohydrolase family protein n=1 Tax=Algoriphagus taiwanensis TaxID=1445656 RepID=A0ABQ6Q5U2_9BACT|nr:amidohydrolase family protein [Algoriphagus taiwanensis]